MYSVANKACMVCFWMSLFFPGVCFSQTGNSFELKGNHNEVHNSQSTSYHLDVDVLICVDNALAGGGQIRSINSFVDLATWCTQYLDTHLHLADSSKDVLYTTIHEIKNSNDETTTLRLINETLGYLHHVYLQNRHRLTVAKIDVFHQKYDELRSFRVLNCLGDKFKLKKSNISDVKYLESDSLSPDVRDIDFELFRMCEGIRMVRVNGRYGYTENDSTFCIDPIFSVAHPFSNGLALVKNHTETWFIDKKGKPVLSLSSRNYLNIWPFEGGYARVQKQNHMYNFIDASGQELFGFDFQFADDFSQGMAAVCVNPPHFYSVLKGMPKYKKQARRLKYVWGPENMGPLDEKCGYITASGYFKIPPTYSAAFSFTEGGRAPVADVSVCEYVKDTGSIFTHKALYTTYLIDTNGNKCSAGYCSITPFGEEWFLAQCGNGYYGVFGPSGLLLADCFYGEPVWVNPFLVYADGISHKYGVMGKNGMVVVPPEYDAIRFLDNSQFELKKGGYTTTVYISPDLKIIKIKQQKENG